VGTGDRKRQSPGSAGAADGDGDQRDFESAPAVAVGADGRGAGAGGGNSWGAIAGVCGGSLSFDWNDGDDVCRRDREMDGGGEREGIEG